MLELAAPIAPQGGYSTSDPIHILLRKQAARPESERSRIDKQLVAIRGALEALDGTSRSQRGPITVSRRRRRMSAAARRAVGRRMKAYWAKRRAEKAKTGRPEKAKAAK